MPRKPRMYLAGMPYHVIARGNNRQACFFKPRDYHFYLDCLAKASEKYKVAVHAYVLMTNHVHLLMSPVASTGISSVMQSVGRRYVQHVNTRYQRSGTLYQSRHSASAISTDRYLLAVHRYIELNPVRANIVERPDDYQCSSYAANALGQPN
ncbi:MAG: transposase, partial [Pseudomonadales bacterium]|nr:transposase [Pseudomonadales bacterium]